MTITFKSNINNNNEIKKIEFTSIVSISKMNEFKVFEFKEPQHNIMNRIEVSQDKVNIFAGSSTVMLSLDEIITNDYQVNGTNLFFESKMYQLSMENNNINFKYHLMQSNKIFGEFDILLKIND